MTTSPRHWVTSITTYDRDQPGTFVATDAAGMFNLYQRGHLVATVGSLSEAKRLAR